MYVDVRDERRIVIEKMQLSVTIQRIVYNIIVAPLNYK